MTFDTSFPASTSTSHTGALYYPHIHFRSRRWLRMAMLYYDSLSRIVPSGFEPDDREFYSEFSDEPGELLSDVRELKAAGFVKDNPPDDNVTEVANEFFDFAMENLIDPVHRAEIVPRLGRRKSFYTIHPSKIDPELLKVLEELKLAHKKQGDPYSDWSVEPVTGGLYMLFLANRMAGNRQLVSDSSIYQSLLYLPMKQTADKVMHDDREFRLATAVLKTVIPSNVEAVKLDVLLGLRRDFSDQRKRFQDKIAGFAKDLQNVSREDSLETVIDRHKRGIEDEYQGFLDKIRITNLGFVQSLFSVSVPAYITSAWGFAATGLPVVFAAGAAAVSAVGMKYFFERRILTKTSPFTYLLNVGKRVRAENMAEDIIQLNLDAPDDDDDDRRVMCAG
jgi:hypothetical protein